MDLDSVNEDKTKLNTGARNKKRRSTIYSRFKTDTIYDFERGNYCESLGVTDNCNIEEDKRMSNGSKSMRVYEQDVKIKRNL